MCHLSKGQTHILVCLTLYAKSLLPPLGIKCYCYQQLTLVHVQLIIKLYFSGYSHVQLLNQDKNMLQVTDILAGNKDILVNSRD